MDLAEAASSMRRNLVPIDLRLTSKISEQLVTIFREVGIDLKSNLVNIALDGEITVSGDFGHLEEAEVKFADGMRGLGVAGANIEVYQGDSFALKFYLSEYLQAEKRRAGISDGSMVADISEGVKGAVKL